MDDNVIIKICFNNRLTYFGIFKECFVFDSPNTLSIHFYKTACLDENKHFVVWRDEKINDNVYIPKNKNKFRISIDVLTKEEYENEIFIAGLMSE